MIGVLGEWKADVNKQDKAGWTPLMFAAVEGNLQAVILLSSLGADPTIENRYHETACTLAGKSGRPADIRERIVRILKYDKSLENGGSQR
jgi:ankyrin repeat protein